MHYNPAGYADKVLGPGASPFTYWQALSRKAWGALGSEQFGNNVTSTRSYHPVRSFLSRIDTALSGSTTKVQGLGYDFDEDHDLTTRVDDSDPVNPVNESFQYDRLHRLKKWSRTGAGAWSVDYGFDDLGNLLTRNFSNGIATDYQGLTYPHPPDGTPHPHAVSAITRQEGVGGTPTSYAQYSYDARGNRQDPGLQYNAFDLPAAISGAASATFAYDAFGGRVKKAGATEVTIYVAGLYEKRTSGNAVTHVLTLHGPGGPVAQVERSYINLNGIEKVQYLHADHLGTVESITDSTGARIARNKFDPFGNRIDMAKPRLFSPPANGAPNVREGFTGHEQDDDLGFINMRGRIYDPKTARFLTADPMVTNPHYGQSFNRYAYVWGNPLKYTDPSGFDAEGDPLSQLYALMDAPGSETGSTGGGSSGGGSSGGGAAVGGNSGGGGASVSPAGTGGAGETKPNDPETVKDEGGRTLGKDGSVITQGSNSDCPGGQCGNSLNDMKGPDQQDTPIGATGGSPIGKGGRPGSPGEGSKGGGRVISPADIEPHGFTVNAPYSGDPDAVETQLPASGPGYEKAHGYGRRENQWGTERTVEFIKTLGQVWHDRFPLAPDIPVGEISQQGGGHLEPHASHDSGRDFDLLLMRNDGQKGPVGIDSGAYDRPMTQHLVDVIRELGGGQIRYIFSVDGGLDDINPQNEHWRSLHVKLRF